MTFAISTEMKNITEIWLWHILMHWKGKNMSEEITRDEKLRQQKEYGKMETMSVRESAKFAFRRKPYSVMIEAETDKD